MIRNLFFILLGVLGGLWVAWPGILLEENWSCAKEIVAKSQEDSTDIRALLAVSPQYLLKQKNQGSMDKIRIIGDACFR
ncbi:MULTISPECIES: hypothetical protein [Prochlorococcus]|uniref:hypothetical protein n=1 Tax=Prochlorococcus TaxID=1218 RepID=UPI0005337983|nr:MULTISPECIES: hypothetical protein [Prochlorococcus]KGG12691.1 hypothetical protein EV05_1909 [Prochlorococcus sp. MIT 0601]